MLCDPRHDNHFHSLAYRLRLAQEVTPDLIADIISVVCVRLPTLRRAGRTDRVEQLVKACAWTDAAVALIELELPHWSVRRLVREEGEWCCSLSREPELPIEIDDTADASHELLPLAILSALVEARRRGAAADERVASVPHVRSTPTPGQVVCCDNFA